MVDSIIAHRSAKGFTLTEVLVVSFLFTLITWILFTSFNTANQVGLTNSNFVDLQQQARQAMDGMSREIRQSRFVDVQVPKPGEPGGSTESISFSIGGDAINYWLDNEQIIRECPAGTTSVLANKISALSFSLDNANNLVEVELTAASANPSMTLSLAEKVWPRN
jgi:prepilin-type N-terminal cleavage/methylation domain-containing protein